MKEEKICGIDWNGAMAPEGKIQSEGSPSPIGVMTAMKNEGIGISCITAGPADRIRRLGYEELLGKNPQYCENGGIIWQPDTDTITIARPFGEDGVELLNSILAEEEIPDRITLFANNPLSDKPNGEIFIFGTAHIARAKEVAHGRSLTVIGDYDVFRSLIKTNSVGVMAFSDKQLQSAIPKSLKNKQKTNCWETTIAPKGLTKVRVMETAEIPVFVDNQAHHLSQEVNQEGKVIKVGVLNPTPIRFATTETDKLIWTENDRRMEELLERGQIKHLFQSRRNLVEEMSVLRELLDQI